METPEREGMQRKTSCLSSITLKLDTKYLRVYGSLQLLLSGLVPVLALLGIVSPVSEEKHVSPLMGTKHGESHVQVA